MARLYRSAKGIAFHCDAADVVGLLCLRAAKQGGQSRIASSVYVFDELLRTSPDLAPELFEGDAQSLQKLLACAIVWNSIATI